MKNAAEILHDVKMQILEMQISATKAEKNNCIHAYNCEEQEQKDIYFSNAAAQRDIIALLEKLLTTAKGE